MYESLFAEIRNHKKMRPPSMPLNPEYEKLRMEINGTQKKCKGKQETKHKAKV